MNYFECVGMGDWGRLEIAGIRHTETNRLIYPSFCRKGNIENKWESGFYGIITNPGERRDFISFGDGDDLWVVSERAREFLYREVGIEQVRCYPLPLRDEAETMEIGGYYLPVWQRVPDCLIAKLSAVYRRERDEETMERMGRFLLFNLSSPGGPLTLSRRLLGDSKFFRIVGLETMVFVRGDVVNKIKKSGLTGFKYLKKDFAIIPTDKQELLDGWRSEGRSEKEIEAAIAEIGNDWEKL